MIRARNISVSHEPELMGCGRHCGDDLDQTELQDRHGGDDLDQTELRDRLCV